MLGEDKIHYYILVVDDEEGVRDGIVQDLEKHPLLRTHYSVVGLNSVQDALETIDTLISYGNRIPIVISDQKMPGGMGTDLLRQVKLLSPKTKRGIITAHYDDPKYLLEMLDLGSDFLFRKPWEKSKDLNLAKIVSLISDYNNLVQMSPEYRFFVGDDLFTTKEADTRFELEEALKMRFATVVGEKGWRTLDDLTQEQKGKGQEWDSFDFGSEIKHIVTKRNPQDGGQESVVGYARVIKKSLPMERAFSLAEERKQGIAPVEVSYALVDPSLRSNRLVGVSLMRTIYDNMGRNDMLYSLVPVAAQAPQGLAQLEDPAYLHANSTMRLFLGLGFLPMSTPVPHPDLQGFWVPMKYDRAKVIDEPRSLPHLNQGFVNLYARPINSRFMPKWVKRGLKEVRVAEEIELEQALHGGN